MVPAKYLTLDSTDCFVQTCSPARFVVTPVGILAGHGAPRLVGPVPMFVGRLGQGHFVLWSAVKLVFHG